MSKQTAGCVKGISHMTRYWSLVHSGAVHAVSWDDGERLLALSTAVRLGKEPAQEFRFCPRGFGDRESRVTLFVGPDSLFELLTEYDIAPPARQSHWFG